MRCTPAFAGPSVAQIYRVNACFADALTRPQGGRHAASTIDIDLAGPGIAVAAGPAADRRPISLRCTRAHACVDQECVAGRVESAAPGRTLAWRHGGPVAQPQSPDAVRPRQP